ncbi:unknown protein [Microcystis aeruginosa NIES-843]|uniref:Uncharacterized protein n=1 Tax=Microcystis aeruginosa (strain NIES-843 / IAM M-2473) TaxID=449447 RepID=B0JMH2_MICAN|nr:unknown protein [Microcystis aeruginosa NIES-843]
MLYSKKLGSIRVCAAYFFGKIGCNGRLFVFLDKNNYFFKKTLFYFFVGYFILWKSLMPLEPGHMVNHPLIQSGVAITGLPDRTRSSLSH